jgi:hypothetical protein
LGTYERSHDYLTDSGNAKFHQRRAVTRRRPLRLPEHIGAAAWMRMQQPFEAATLGELHTVQFILVDRLASVPRASAAHDDNSLYAVCWSRTQSLPQAYWWIYNFTVDVMDSEVHIGGASWFLVTISWFFSIHFWRGYDLVQICFLRHHPASSINKISCKLDLHCSKEITRFCAEAVKRN